MENRSYGLPGERTCSGIMRSPLRLLILGLPGTAYGLDRCVGNE